MTASKDVRQVEQKWLKQAKKAQKAAHFLLFVKRSAGALPLFFVLCTRGGGILGRHHEPEREGGARSRGLDCTDTRANQDSEPSHTEERGGVQLWTCLLIDSHDSNHLTSVLTLQPRPETFLLGQHTPGIPIRGENKRMDPYWGGFRLGIDGLG